MINRRALLSGSLALLNGAAMAQGIGGGGFSNVNNRPKFGAIRWDGWYSMISSPVTEGYQLAVDPGPMAPNAWQFRSPVHAITGNNTISWAGASQATFDNEIRAANAFGLDYWVFDHYDVTGGLPNTSLNIALGYYLASTLKSRPRFAVMEATWSLGTTGNYSAQIAYTLTLVQNSFYQFVKGNRPLIYVYYDAGNITTYWGGSNANFKAALDAMRALIQAAGFANPYLVILNGGASSGTVPTALGADCYGRYVGPIPGTATPYATMAATDQGYWITDAAAFSPYIPTVNVGFDPTPINNLPPPWWSNNPSTVIEPTLAELLANYQAASNFVKANPVICDAHTVLVYSWSECAEGGVTMMPTIGNPTGWKGQALLNVH